ncbi:MAG: acyltransferase [Nostocales cyanobacterium 94392]|nr:acyltransferase [Nostocales cyanobacterium 94392]
MQWQILAGLRFFLAWIVFCNHLRWFVPSENFLLKFNQFSAFSAVLGFFMISGYSIAHSISKKSEGFYKRRLIRLYPLYFLGVIVSLLPFFFLESQIQTPYGEFIFARPGWKAVIGNLLFMKGLIIEPISSNPILWTLGLEVFCYLLAPFLIKLSTRKIYFLVILSAFTYVLYPHLGLPYYSHLKYGLGLVFLIWSWLLGFLYFREKTGPNAITVKVLIIALGCVLLGANGFPEARLEIFTYVLSCLILMYSTSIKLPQKLLKILDYLGEISYSFYVFHIPTLIFGYYILEIRNALGLVLISLLTSILFYYAVEVPLKRIRTKSHLTSIS